MGDLHAQKYREYPPQVIVARIKGILSGLGIQTVESEWQRCEEGFNSLRLTIPGTWIGSNGKGTTPDYALASAYGELMERLGNMAPFLLEGDMPGRAHRRGSFLYAPDEIPMGMADILYSGDPWIGGLWEGVPGGTDRVSYLRLWRQVSYEKRAYDFYGIPYQSLLDGRTHTLPAKMIHKLYMSNGMCAGSSMEEALLHGLCECFERYANRMAVLKSLPLSAIPRDISDTWPGIGGLMRSLEERGYTVTLYDASLGVGLPVTAALVTDPSEGRYLVRFGAAPCPGLAAERALTELMQGREMGRIGGIPVHPVPNQDAGQGLMGILSHGTGQYPLACFTEGGAGAPPPDYGAPTIRGTLHRLLKLAQDLGYDVLARDASYLGFPAAHVVVPGMSEIGDFGDREEIARYVRYHESKRLIRALGSLDMTGCQRLLSLLSDCPEKMGVLEWLRLPIREEVPWYYHSMRLLKISLALRCKEYRLAADLLDAQSREEEGRSSLYYRCARDICLLRGDGKDERAAGEVLGRFYPEEILFSAMEGTGAEPYRQGTLPCFNCGECPWRQACPLPGTEKIHALLKKEMKKAGACVRTPAV